MRASTGEVNHDEGGTRVSVMTAIYILAVSVAGADESTLTTESKCKKSVETYLDTLTSTPGTEKVQPKKGLSKAKIDDLRKTKTDCEVYDAIGAALVEHRN